MTELGTSVFKAIEFIAAFHTDVSLLVTTVEERMLGQRLAPFYGSSAIWNRSTAYQSGTNWMPRWIARLYAPSTRGGKKPNMHSGWFACFNVYFTPKYIGEPVAIWGIGRQRGEEDLSDPVGQLLVHRDGPDFLLRATLQDWEPVGMLSEALSMFRYQASLVVELNDVETVERLVVQPLLDEIGKLRDPG